MKKIVLLACLPVFAAGCLSSKVPEVANWTVEFAATPSLCPTGEVVRISQVVVSPPYDDRNLVVLRENGSVAFDPFNSFAALPSQMLKAPIRAILESSGRWSAVLWTASSARARLSLEVCVEQLALDCRQEDARVARVSLACRLVDKTDGAILFQTQGKGAADAADGNYGRAFSEAFAAAARQALAGF